MISLTQEQLTQYLRAVLQLESLKIQLDDMISSFGKKQCERLCIKLRLFKILPSFFYAAAGSAFIIAAVAAVYPSFAAETLVIPMIFIAVCAGCLLTGAVVQYLLREGFRKKKSGHQHQQQIQAMIRCESVMKMLKHHTETILQGIYAQNILLERYRNREAAGCIYQWLKEGQCTGLEGKDGAYSRIGRKSKNINYSLKKCERYGIALVRQRKTAKRDSYELYRYIIKEQYAQMERFLIRYAKRMMENNRSCRNLAQAALRELTEL